MSVRGFGCAKESAVGVQTRLVKTDVRSNVDNAIRRRTSNNLPTIGSGGVGDKYHSQSAYDLKPYCT